MLRAGAPWDEADSENRARDRVQGRAMRKCWLELSGGAQQADRSRGERANGRCGGAAWRVDSLTRHRVTSKLSQIKSLKRVYLLGKSAYGRFGIPLRGEDRMPLSEEY